MKTKAPTFHDPLPPLQMLLSQQCWGIAAGSGTGAAVSLHLGRKLPRLRRLDNPSLDAVLRTHQGEAILFIECQWSLQSKNKVRFDSESDDGGEKMMRALRHLVGASVSQIVATMPPRDLSLQFSNGDWLKLRTDEPDPDDSHDNFSLAVGDIVFIVGPDLGLRIEPRKGVVPAIAGCTPAGIAGALVGEYRKGIRPTSG